jgi:hypothetical protein
VTLHGLSVDDEGRLAVIGGEEGLIEGNEPGVYAETYTLLGAVYDVKNGQRLSEFYVPIGNDGVSFGPDDSLYVVATDAQSILKYSPTPVIRLFSGVADCSQGEEVEELVTFTCL